MPFAAYFFWMGLVVLVLAALTLRWLEVDRMDARIARALAALGLGRLEPIRVIACGSVGVSVWGFDTPGAVAKYVVTVNRRNAKCDRCVNCLNEAIQWIEERALAA